MSDKIPRDEYDDDRRPEEESYGFPGAEDDLTEEERDFAFDEDYAEGNDPVRHESGSFYEEYEEDGFSDEGKKPLAGALGRLTAKAGARKAASGLKQKLQSLVPRSGEKTPRPKVKQPKGKPEYGERAPVTVGMDLRSDQMLVYDSELDDIDYTDDEDLPEMRDYMPIRFRRYGRVGIGGGILYALFVISASVVLACLAWMFASDVLALNKEESSAIVTVEQYEPEGDDPVTTLVNDEEMRIKVDIDQVATALKNAGVIDYKWLFKLFSGISHAEVKIDPGTYDVSTNLDYRAIVTTLQFGSGKQEVTQVTFPEGFTVEQIFTLLEENQICDKEELYDAAANYEFDYDFLEGLELGDPNRLEGYLFPDTYEFYQGEDASVAINRFLQNLDNKLTDEIRDRASDMGMSVHELITFASLVEKEAGSDEERTTISSIIHNRLDDGWKLQLDSTINYIKGTSTFDISFDDMEIDSPYNTYLYEGLPIGPICSPGLASIEAALYPGSTDYWFWYAYEGETSFFTNKDDFDAFAEAHPY